jgi:SAM-dependent methyltransferase
MLYQESGMDTAIVRWDAPHAIERYRRGEWRDRIFRDLIFADVQPHGNKKMILDIGCGNGFDGDVPLQRSIAQVAGTFLGIEPDEAIVPGSYFHHVHRCRFEDAPLAPESIDVAYAIMVLEHLPEPQPFFDKVWQVLRKGGVFWSLTVDRRHWFCSFSRWFERLRIKDVYLNWLLGRRGEERYENYPVFYRSNSPDQIDSLTTRFARKDYINFSRIGQCNAYFPRLVRPVASALDSRAIRQNRPGTLLAIRVEK